MSKRLIIPWGLVEGNEKGNRHDNAEMILWCDLLCLGWFSANLRTRFTYTILWKSLKALLSFWHLFRKMGNGYILEISKQMKIHYRSSQAQKSMFGMMTFILHSVWTFLGELSAFSFKYYSGIFLQTSWRTHSKAPLWMLAVFYYFLC